MSKRVWFAPWPLVARAEAYYRRINEAILHWSKNSKDHNGIIVVSNDFRFCGKRYLIFNSHPQTSTPNVSADYAFILSNEVKYAYKKVKMHVE